MHRRSLGFSCALAAIFVGYATCWLIDRHGIGSITNNPHGLLFVLKNLNAAFILTLSILFVAVWPQTLLAGWITRRFQAHRLLPFAIFFSISSAAACVLIITVFEIHRLIGFFLVSGFLFIPSSILWVISFDPHRVEPHTKKLSALNKLIAMTSIVVGFLLVGTWFELNLFANEKYDQMIVEMGPSYQVAPMDQKAKSFMQDVLSNWNCKANQVGGPDSDILKLAGMIPSLTNLIRLWTYPFPDYSWWFPSRNRKAATIGLLKAKFAPVSVNHIFYVSDDQHEALLWCKSNVVFIYHDETNGLRASLFVTNRSVKINGP